MPSAQDRARVLAIAQDFGAEALELNRQLVAADPSDAASRTRLGRCYLETGRLDEAEAEYREVLRLDPKNRIAAGGLEAVERSRHAGDATIEQVKVRRTPRAPRERVSSPRSSSTSGPVAVSSLGPVPSIFGGFQARDFTELTLCPRNEVAARFAPRVVDLMRRVNALQTSAEIAAIREPGKRQLFRLSRAEVRGRAAHWFVHNAGGRWEPQFNIGMYGGRERSSDWLRIGLGYNLSDSGRESDAEEGIRAAREHFRRFQAVLASPRRSLLSGWLIKEGGFIEQNADGPRLDLRDASQAAEVLAAADVEHTRWAFAGKWLSPASAEDAAVLADPVSLVRTIDRVFAGLLPLWRALWQ
jgi:tetratricopeptide (TPR) repeat protein